MKFNEDYRTPRDRVSAEMRSQDRNSCGCGENSEHASHNTSNNSCGCSRSDGSPSRNSSCGCRENTERISRNMSNNSCGCSRRGESTSRNSSCGCRENAERISHNMSNNSCGCSHSGENTADTVRERNCRSAESSCGISRSNISAGTARRYPNTVCTTVPVEEGCVDGYPIAMAYVPMQQWRELYDPMSGISHGTIFRELDLPWYPTNCGNNGNNCRK